MASDERRIDLDWIRILAFGTLILYHVGMYYVTWDWHVKSPHASHALEPLMMLTNPWRLSLLFLVSGAATAFIVAKSAGGAFALSRSKRLLVPLVFTMLVIVPPQSYFEVVEKAGYGGSYWEFWGRYLHADRGFCRGDDCLIVPTWNHLWFVAYLWVYTLVVAATVKWAPTWPARATRSVEGALAGWRVVWVPIVFLATVRIALVGRFPQTHALVDDWYNHAQYLPVFLLGFLVARSDAVWASMERIRWQALALGAAAYAFIAWYFVFRDPVVTPDALRIAQRAIYGLDQWAFIVAACGFARRHIHRDGPARRYLTEAIFPFYIVHQTAIVLLAVWMRPLQWPAPVEGLVLATVVALVCVIAYEGVRRVPALRPLFGLR